MGYAKTLKKDDLMVIILPYHGTRYLGKVYSDTWMATHDFLDEGNMLTAEQILKNKSNGHGLVTLDAGKTLGDAVRIMREQNISQIPVIRSDEIIGSLNENRVLNTILDNPSLKDAPVTDAMSDPLPFVLSSTRVDVISKLIHKDNPAVIVQSSEGELDIL